MRMNKSSPGTTLGYMLARNKYRIGLACLIIVVVFIVYVIYSVNNTSEYIHHTDITPEERIMRVQKNLGDLDRRITKDIENIKKITSKPTPVTVSVEDFQYLGEKVDDLSSRNLKDEKALLSLSERVSVAEHSVEAFQSERAEDQEQTNQHILSLIDELKLGFEETFDGLKNENAKLKANVDFMAGQIDDLQNELNTFKEVQEHLHNEQVDEPGDQTWNPDILENTENENAENENNEYSTSRYGEMNKDDAFEKKTDDQIPKEWNMDAQNEPLFPATQPSDEEITYTPPAAAQSLGNDDLGDIDENEFKSIDDIGDRFLKSLGLDDRDNYDNRDVPALQIEDDNEDEVYEIPGKKPEDNLLFAGPDVDKDADEHPLNTPPATLTAEDAVDDHVHDDIPDHEVEEGEDNISGDAYFNKVQKDYDKVKFGEAVKTKRNKVENSDVLEDDDEEKKRFNDEFEKHHKKL